MNKHQTAARPPQTRPRPGRPKDTQKRAAILAAAGACFLKYGFEGASMDAIANEAGISKLTVYSHFQNKDELFRAVIADKCEEHRSSDSFLGFADEEPRKALASIGMAAMRLLTAPEVLAMYRLVIGESGRNPQVAALLYEAGPKRVSEDFVELLRAWLKKGKLDLRDARRAADHFFAMLKGDIQFRALINLEVSPSDVELKRHVDDCIDVFLRAYARRR